MDSASRNGNDLIIVVAMDILVAPPDSAIPLDVQQFATQSIALHHDLTCGCLWPCRVSETTLHLDIGCLHEIEITWQEQILSQPLCINAIECLHVWVTPYSAMHAGTNRGALLAALVSRASTGLADACRRSHVSRRALVHQTRWLWFRWNFLAALIGSATIVLLTIDGPIPECIMVAATHVMELDLHKSSWLAPATVLLPHPRTTLPIVVGANVVPIVAIDRSLDLKSPVPIIGVGALRQTHGADCILSLQVHHKPSVVTDIVACMPMVVGSIIDGSESAPVRIATAMYRLQTAQHLVPTSSTHISLSSWASESATRGWWWWRCRRYFLGCSCGRRGYNLITALVTGAFLVVTCIPAHVFLEAFRTLVTIAIHKLRRCGCCGLFTALRGCAGLAGTGVFGT